jgi:hypothetical protein
MADRTFTGGRFGIMLDGSEFLGFVNKMSGGLIKTEIAPTTKKWLCSNFRFELGDLPCERVAKIDSFTWKMGVVKDKACAFRILAKHRAKVEVPNLRVTASIADVKPWGDWHRSFLLERNCGDDAELNGSITFLSPDLREALGKIDLLNVGIVSLDTWWQEANEEVAARFTVDLLRGGDEIRVPGFRRIMPGKPAQATPGERPSRYHDRDQRRLAAHLLPGALDRPVGGRAVFPPIPGLRDLPAPGRHRTFGKRGSWSGDDGLRSAPQGSVLGRLRTQVFAENKRRSISSNSHQSINDYGFRSLNIPTS